MPKPKISAKAILDDLKRGMSDLELMAKYQVSERGLESIFQKLLAVGQIDQSALQNRDSRPHTHPSLLPQKKKISPKEICNDVRNGLTDDQLMEKYGLNDHHLPRLFHQLIAKGFLSQSEIENRVRESREPADAEEPSLSPPREKNITEDRVHVPPEPALTPSSSEQIGLWGRIKAFLRKASFLALFLIFALLSLVVGFVAYNYLGDYWFIRLAWALICGIITFKALTLLATVVGQRKMPGFSVTGMFVSIVTGKALFKLIAYLMTALLFTVSLSLIWYMYEMRMFAQYQALRRIDPYPEAQSLLLKNGPCAALEYLDYMREYEYVRNDPRVTEYYEQTKAARKSIVRGSGRTVWAFMRGSCDCIEECLAVGASDFFVVGDARDLVLQGLKYMRGEDVDEFTATLASVGVLATGATIVTGGGAAPVKVSLSSLKLAKRLNRLSKPFQKDLLKVLAKCKALKNLGPLKHSASTVHQITKIPGIKAGDMMKILSRCNRIDDLKDMARFASTFGSKTGKVLRLGGETAVDVFKKYPRSKGVVSALDEALKYGSHGTDLLKKIGPEKLLKFTKLSARGIRTIHEGRLQLMLLALLKLLPEWLIWVIAALTGLITIGIPARSAVKRWKLLRRTSS